MQRQVAIVTLALCSACTTANQPESLRTVEAIEVPITTAADRSDLVAILQRHAAIDGEMHVDEVSRKWRAFEAQAENIAQKDRGTIFVGVWRGKDDDEPEADVVDSGHPRRAWLTFARGTLPEKSTVFRIGVIRDIRNRWAKF